MAVMQAGKMHTQAVVQTVSRAKGDQGQVVGTWNDGATIWISLVPVVAREMNVADKTSGHVTHQVFCHYAAGAAITTNNRLKVTTTFGTPTTRFFQIDSPPVNVDERFQLIRFDVMEIVSGD